MGWHEVRALSERQFGYVSRHQARHLGITWSALRAQVRTGEWEAVTAHVVRRLGSPRTFAGDCMAAALDVPGLVAVTGPAACRLWRLPTFVAPRIDLLTTRTAVRHSPLSILHHTRFLPAHHVVRMNGIPVVTPTRLVFELAAWVHPDRLERVVNTAWSKRLTDGRRLQVAADELLERGRGGSRAMRELLERRPVSWIPPQSGTATRFMQIIREAGMPEPVPEVDTGDEATWLGRLDFRDPTHVHLGAEIDSDLYHLAPLDQALDADREGGLRRAGMVLERFTEREVWGAPGAVVARWRAARRRAGRRAG